VGTSTFLGDPISGTSHKGVIIRYTYMADANLDGMVDNRDLAAIASNWQQTSRDWFRGDFNYDGIVNITDLYLLAQNYLAGTGSPLLAAPMNLGAALASLNLPTPGSPSIPEPDALQIVALLAPLWQLSRRRRQVL
jgi:hypothetical protein